MIFGNGPTTSAEGAILAHGCKVGRKTFKKGRVISAGDVADLLAAGIEQIVAARLEKGDLGEDVAARRIADAASGAHVAVRRAFTGRANLYAGAPGVLVIDGEAVDGVNRVNEAVTIATLPSFEVVEPGQMVATVKIIPFAVDGAVVEDCASRAEAGGGLIRVAKLTELGMIARPMINDSIGLCPPLIITDSQVDDMFDILDQAVDITHKEYVSTL